jgi:hypothetical protein
MNPVGVINSLTTHNSLALNSKQGQQKLTLEQDMMQLGQDVQSGNLSAARTDFAVVQQTAGYSHAMTNGNFAQAANQVSSDLQTGNVSGLKKDFSTLRTSLHSIGSGSSQESISQIWSELGNAIQGGSLSTAAQAYASLGQELQQYTSGAGTSGAAGFVNQLISAGLSAIA